METKTVEYKGYYTDVKYDDKDKIYYGKIDNPDFIGLLCYEGKTLKSAIKDFKKGVDYIYSLSDSFNKTDNTYAITKDILLIIGFTENEITPEENGTDKSSFYYTYYINDNCLLISDCNDECDNNYTVEFFNLSGVKIKNSEDLITIINTIEKCKVNGC